MKYQMSEDNMGTVAEDYVVNYTINKRSDISRAITVDELMNRLRPRIESLFK